jgi:uncharacterized protein (DUF433 family)
MREFKRITVDPKVKNGLPCVRDTEITVSEVVKRMMQKYSHEILADYPNLEAEDIEEALLYAIQDFSQTINTSAFEMRAPITSIQGFSDLFLKSPEKMEITDEQKMQFVEAISKSGVRAARMLTNLLSWSRTIYVSSSHPSRRGVPISQVLDDAGIPKRPETTISIPEELPPVRDNGNLFMAFANLIDDDLFGRFKNESRITVGRADETRISVQIERPFGNVATKELPNSVLYPTSPISTAAIIIQEHESELQIQVTNDSILFQFELPIWIENTST